MHLIRSVITVVILAAKQSLAQEPFDQYCYLDIQNADFSFYSTNYNLMGWAPEIYAGGNFAWQAGDGSEPLGIDGTRGGRMVFNLIQEQGWGTMTMNAFFSDYLYAVPRGTQQILSWWVMFDAATSAHDLSNCQVGMSDGNDDASIVPTLETAYQWTQYTFSGPDAVADGQTQEMIIRVTCQANVVAYGGPVAWKVDEPGCPPGAKILNAAAASSMIIPTTASSTAAVCQVPDSTVYIAQTRTVTMAPEVITSYIYASMSTAWVTLNTCSSSAVISTNSAASSSFSSAPTSSFSSNASASAAASSSFSAAPTSSFASASSTDLCPSYNFTTTIVSWLPAATVTTWKSEDEVLASVYASLVLLGSRALHAHFHDFPSCDNGMSQENSGEQAAAEYLLAVLRFGFLIK
ncbi:uncharacterized protein LY89DRAFT_746958 [Mollisia scopiformis]|uniref:Ig-like domain-containing protein n=1 Tax=Mollisia scopiformis TaxID=149040 RepID=A0A194XB93_MOLSC|nr:uncharacterized protein LY89DRAFT_746958 [Mollisia scopiformis]KUJ17414.1 hypothetical protein LY89DRAFT_746958 [Mollisia scopiformis]